MKKKLKVIVDCNALCYKAFHIMPKDLKFKKHDTSIIFGFLNQIRKLAEDLKTNQFIFCWDSPRSYRKLIYPDYKENRGNNLSDVQKDNLLQAKEQFIELEEEVLPGLGFMNIYSQNGYEADDWIAYFAFRLPWNYLIVSGDEDLYQCLYDGDKVQCHIFNGKKVITEQAFGMMTGLMKPIDWVQVKALAGCTSDNIKGIVGVGESTAIKYLKGQLAEGKIKDRIEDAESKRIFHRNLQLVTLPYSGGPKPLKGFDGYPPDDELYSVEFMEIFKEYGFMSFLGDRFDKWRKAFDLMSGPPPRR